MNILMTLIVSLFLGLQSQTGTFLPDGSLEQRLMALLNNTDTVEIMDESVPLAGPGTSGSITVSHSGRASNTPSQPSSVTPQNSSDSQEEQPSEPNEEEQASDPGEEEQASDPGEEEQASDPGEEEQPSDPNEEEQETPVVTLSVAQQLLQRARELLAQYNTCTSLDEKKELLGTTNYSVGNDALRSKLLADNGGSWDQVETEIVDATEYQQGKTLYAQVYMSGTSDDYQPVVYATLNSDRSGNQWSTNLVYDEQTDTWMEYVKKHPYNNSRVGYGMTQLAADGALENLEEQFETSELWQAVIVTTDAGATGDVAPQETTDTETSTQTAAPTSQETEQPAQQTSPAADAPAEVEATTQTAE